MATVAEPQGVSREAKLKEAEAEAVQPQRACKAAVREADPPRTSGQKAMYEHLMEAAVTPDNYQRALEAVKRNQGAPGIDRMRTEELEAHLQAHWEKIRGKLLAGTYVPTPVKRVEIPKPSGGVRKLGIPTVLDRFIQQLLLQVMTPIFEPLFSEHSYGFRPGRSAHDAVAAAQGRSAGQPGRGYRTDSAGQERGLASGGPR